MRYERRCPHPPTPSPRPHLPPTTVPRFHYPTSLPTWPSPALPHLQSSYFPPQCQPVPNDSLPQLNQPLTPPNIPPLSLNQTPKSKPQHSHSLEVCGPTFRIDSKLFSLGFDGGRFNPYHVMERQGKFQGSLWLGIRGLRWALGEMGKLKDFPST